ncbi:hypothetical protein FKW77_009798 [Venturia effusa]|uniref:Carbohydrate kinase PfkB domain-containing protein n=1 Tax=Venturia effusa TaxID=50376 RepID=A0A517LA16_9PEZI|nr:hypothetical protein FKW77_009798 [Venturia effusa]
MPHIICIGACYIDTILNVPHFPTEDEKLRCTGLTKRRGGNCPNTLEVLNELKKARKNITSHQLRPDLQDVPPVVLNLVSVLPSPYSAASRFICSSLPSSNFDHCIFRGFDYQESSSSYILLSAETGSRTIVNHQPLPDMTFDEFRQIVDEFKQLDVMEDRGKDQWWHFEGRIPETTLRCMEYLIETLPNAKISVEVEKPNRPGLEEMAVMAHIVFYARSWVSAKGYTNAGDFLHSLKAPRPLQFCTWGEEGAAAFISPSGETGDPVQHSYIFKADLPRGTKVIDR